MKRFLGLSALLAALAAPAAPTGAAWSLALPDGAVGYNFGNLVIEPLKNVMAKTAYTDARGFGFVSAEGLSHAGGHWPDPLTGTFAAAALGRGGVLTGKQIEFRADMPNGEYVVWLSAGKIVRPKIDKRRYLLKLNDKVLLDETPTDEQLAGEKYLYRFLWTPYAEAPEAIWANYIEKMYPAATQRIKVTDGRITVVAANHFLSALIAAPVAKQAEMDKLLAGIRAKRIELFAAGCKPLGKPAPARQSGDGDYVLYVPRTPEDISPWTGPTPAERKAAKIDAAGAPGQNVLMVLAVVPFADLGECSLELADLTGPGTIPAAAIKGHFKNYRYDGKGLGRRVERVAEMALLPRLRLKMPKGITQSLWLWMRVPAGAKAGAYTGTFTFRPGKGAPARVPVKFEVYPFKLAGPLPVAYGFWGTGYDLPLLSAEKQRKVMKDRLEWMKETGFTSITVPGPAVKQLHKDGRVELTFRPMLWELAKEVGLAASPKQPLLDAGLMAGVGRQIGRRLPGSSRVYDRPGIELLQTDFKRYFLHAVRQYRAFIDKIGLPTVVTSVDEPRERRINSWNRNYDDTVAYCDMMKEGGLTVCVNPMRDVDHYVNKDYTGFIDHVDVLSTHAWEPSKRFMRLTLAKSKVLWLYNCGKDRYSWGFYNWRARSNGRWEWHFCWTRDGAVGGYPGREWYNPFTSPHGLNPSAPYTTCKGGILYCSAMLSMAEGINDYAYLYTLEQALASPAAGKHPETAKKAKAFLAALRRAMPEFPKVKGLASASDGAAVGMGIEDEARFHVRAWRKKLAEFLKQLAG